MRDGAKARFRECRAAQSIPERMSAAPMDVDAPGRAWLPEVRRQHLDLDVGFIPGAGGYVEGHATIVCRPPANGSGDVTSLTLHAHELVVTRVTVDDAPARVIRRGRTAVRPDGSDDPSGDDDVALQPGHNASALSSGANVARDACEGMLADARALADGAADELVIALEDGGVIYPGHRGSSPSTSSDVVVRVWYGAGTAMNAFGTIPPDSWRHIAPPVAHPPSKPVSKPTDADGAEDAIDVDDGGKNDVAIIDDGKNDGTDVYAGWCVPGDGAMCAFRDPDEDGERYIVAPGSALRPAAWFPCVDDGGALVHFSATVRVDPDLTAVLPGVLTKTETIETSETTADGTTQNVRRKAFHFVSGGVPVQAHQMVLAVGTFATRKIPTSDAHQDKFAAAARAEEEDKEEEAAKEAAKKDADGADAHARALADNAAGSTAHSSTHALHCPPRYGENELPAAASCASAALASFETYLGRPMPYPGGLVFCFVPPDALPVAMDAQLPALLGAGVTILSTDRLGHPLSAQDLVTSRTAIAECAARQLFGGFLEPREDTDAWLAEGLASYMAGACYVSSLMGADELKYRRAREVDAVVERDDGDAVPPLASSSARIWARGRDACGASAEEVKARFEQEANARGEDPEASSKEHVRAVPPTSKPPRPPAPDVELLVRYKAVAVVGMLERKLGEEGMQKVIKKLASLQGKAPGAESLQEAFLAASKATRAAKEKAAAAAEAAKTEGADESANAAAKEKAAATAREQLQREHQEAIAYHALAESPARYLRSRVFLNLCRQNATMTKQDMSAFIARWIEGCGCPRLTAGYTFRKTRRQELLFAIKLDGCLAAAAADRVAWSKNPKVSVTVRIQENDLPPSDHAVSLSAHDRAYVLMPLQLVTKPKDRRTIARQQAAALNRQQKAREEGVANPDSLDAMAAAEVLQWECPVSWVRVDPEGEWLAKVILPPAQQGLEGMITKQLMSERPADPAAQTWAIRFLQERAEHGSTSAVNALLQCAEDPKIFCRVRAAAAMALGACACDGTQRSNLALSSVTRTYRKRRCDPETGKPAPTDLTDFAAAIVDEGLVTALGLPRAPPEGAGGNGGDESTWVTPSECVELLVDMLDGLQSDGDPHDPSSLIARAIHALGDARPATLDTLLQIVRAIAKRMRENANICGVGGRAHEGGRRVTVAGMLALRSLLSRIPPLPESLSAANEAKKALAAEPKSKRRGGSALALDGELGAREKKRLADAALGAVVADAVETGRSFVRAGIDDPCPAVRRAAASLQFGIEARHGGQCGVARALAFTTLACKAERSGGVRAAMLWDARDGILSTEDAPAQLASLTRGAPDGGGDAGSKDSHGFDIFEWASTSLRIAARRAGAETASAALALLHAANGLTGFADEKDAADAKARELARNAVLAGAAQAVNEVEDEADEAERAERRRRKEEKAKARAEKEEKRARKEERRARKRAAAAVAAAEAAKEAAAEAAAAGIKEEGTPSEMITDMDGDVTMGGMSEGGPMSGLTGGVTGVTGGDDAEDSGAPSEGKSADPMSQATGTPSLATPLGTQATTTPPPAAAPAPEPEPAPAPAPPPVAAAGPAPPAEPAQVVGVKRGRDEAFASAAGTPSSAPAAAAAAVTPSAEQPAKKPKLVFAFGKKPAAAPAAPAAPEPEVKEKKEKKEKKDKKEKKEKKEKREKERAAAAPAPQ